MKKFLVTAFLLVGCVGVPVSLRGCRSFDASGGTPRHVTTVELSGTPGASFQGDYLAEGKDVAIAGTLPWSLTATNVSELEIRKIEPQDTVVAEARGGQYGSTIHFTAEPGTRRLRLDLEGGWSAVAFSYDWTVGVAGTRFGFFSYAGSSTDVCYGFGTVHVSLPPLQTVLATCAVMALVAVCVALISFQWNRFSQRSDAPDLNREQE